ncbi:MAG: hypothetical protein E2P00_02590 [Acidobacteria bacterium]|nr:MAG: hypothetical protein E2P00_02590 [Acidobacteriota bacterium]
MTEVVIDPGAPAGAEAGANCDEIAGAMQARSFLSELVETAFDASASAAVFYDFTVDAEPESEGNSVEGTLAYSLSWRGVTEISGAGAYLVNINLAVDDITDPGTPVPVASVVIHEQDSGTGVDEGSLPGTLSLILVRGHSYRVTASLATLAVTESSVDPVSAVADYLSDVGTSADPAGAWVDMLAVQVGFDLADLAAQVEANTMAIESNTLALAEVAEATEANTEAISGLTTFVALLAEEVAAIKQALEDLGDEVANHTHTYLTGKGRGHNNTVATTGTPDGDDGGDPTPEPVARGRSGKFKR